MQSTNCKSYLCRMKSSAHRFQISIMRSNYPLLICNCDFTIEYIFFKIINLEPTSKELKIRSWIHNLEWNFKKNTQGVEGRAVDAPHPPYPISYVVVPFKMAALTSS